MASGTMRILTAALCAALITAGGAFALGSSKSRGGGGLGVHSKNLTFAEIHSQKDGKEVVTRIDRGKVKAVNSSAITLTRNDGQDVTIAIAERTKVFKWGEKHADVGDIDVGDKATVTRRAGGSAKWITVSPSRSHHAHKHKRHGDDRRGHHRRHR